MSRKTRVAELKPKVLEYIENAVLPLSINDVAKHFNISWGTARQVLMELWGEGKIIAEKTTKSWIFKSKRKNEPLAHRILKEKAKNWLRSQGFERIVEEYPVVIDGKKLLVDVVGFKKGKKVAVECGHYSLDKVALLKKYFDEVKTFPYTPKINTSQDPKYLLKLLAREMRTTKIKCPKCGYVWIHRGSLMTATCPNCGHGLQPLFSSLEAFLDWVKGEDPDGERYFCYNGKTLVAVVQSSRRRAILRTSIEEKDFDKVSEQLEKLGFRMVEEIRFGR